MESITTSLNSQLFHDNGDILRLPDSYCQGYCIKIMSLVVVFSMPQNHNDENDKDIIYLQSHVMLNIAHFKTTGFDPT